MGAQAKNAAQGPTAAFEPPTAVATAAHEPAPGNGPKPEPCLSPDQELVLSEGLLAIAEEIHNQPEAEAHSLSHWFTWLDEEGYDQPGIARALQQLCQQRLGAEAGQQLQAQAKARADDPQGVPSAIEHLSQNHPELLEELLAIEQTRQEQLQRIHAMAGGVRWGKVGGNAGQVILGAGIALLIIKLGHKIHTNWEKELDRKHNDHILQQEKMRLTESARLDLGSDWDTWKGELTNDLIPNVVRNEKSTKLLVRLSDLTPDQIKDLAGIKMTRASVLGTMEEFGFGSEIGTRLLRSRLPKAYLDGFQQWAKKEAGKTFSFELSELKRANDIPHDLRREFERSDFAHKFISNLVKPGKCIDYGVHDFRDTGCQAFFGKELEKYYFNNLLTQQSLLKEIKESGTFTAEHEELDTNLIFDFSDQTMHDILAKHGEAMFRYAIAADKEKVVTPETWTYVVNTAKALDSDAIASKCAAFQEAEGILDAHVQKVTTLEAKLDKLVSEGKLTSDSKEILLKKLDTAAIKSLRRKVKGAKDEIETESRYLYLDERKELADQIESCLDNDLKSDLLKKLDDMDDVADWIDSRKETIVKRFDDYVMTDTKLAFQDALKAAKDSAKATDEAFESVEKDLLNL